MNTKSKLWNYVSLMILAVTGLPAAGCGKSPRFQADMQSRQVLEKTLGAAISCTDEGLCSVDPNALYSKYPDVKIDATTVEVGTLTKKKEFEIRLFGPCSFARTVAGEINRLLGPKAFPYGGTPEPQTENYREYQQDCKVKNICYWREWDSETGVECFYSNDGALQVFGMKCTYTGKAGKDPIKVVADAETKAFVTNNGCDVVITVPAPVN